MRLRFLLLALGPFGVSAAAASEPIQLALPIACEIGKSCFVQQYVDDDPGPGARDYRCGTLTYDGHNGTDFRLPSMAAQRSGVEVRAAAEGRVLRVRDGVPDVSIRAAEAAKADGRECGNGVVLAHAGGWETQYCHLAQGSVQVKPGDAVRAGEAIGRVGLSGQTEFPHLHLTVRQNGAVVDPFAPAGRAETCKASPSLWSPAAQAALEYRERSVLNSGFASGPVSMAAIEAGDVGVPSSWSDAPALVAFVRAIGLKKDDVQMLSITAPDGRVLAEHREGALDRNKAQTMLFAGLKRPASGWGPGQYRAHFTVRSGESVVLEQDFALNL